MNNTSPQKFIRGDKVKLPEKFPLDMQHFEGTGETAIVIGSFQDLHGNGISFSAPSYGLYFPVLGGKVSGEDIYWYPEYMLTMVSPRNIDQLDILDDPGRRIFTADLLEHEPTVVKDFGFPRIQCSCGWYTAVTQEPGEAPAAFQKHLDAVTGKV